MSATQHIRDLIRTRVPRSALSEAVLQLADIQDRQAQQISELQQIIENHQALLELQTRPGCGGCSACKPKAEGKGKAKGQTKTDPAETKPEQSEAKPAEGETPQPEQPPAEAEAAPAASANPDEPQLGSDIPESQE